MNCDTLHRRLLALERPDRPPPDLRGHLAACPACREWYARLLRLEGQAVGLPVPPPRGRSAFVERFLQGARGPEGPSTPAAPGRLLPFSCDPPSALRNSQPGNRERALRKVAVAVAMAAALLLVALGVWAWQHDAGTGTGKPPVAELSPLERVLKDNARWARAETPRDRLGVLGDIADEVRGKVRSLARARTLKGLDQQVRLYEEIIDRIARAEAPEVAPGERERVLLPLAQRLATAESEARREAHALPDAAPPLRQLAAAAHEGERRLRALLRENAVS